MTAPDPLREDASFYRQAHTAIAAAHQEHHYTATSVGAPVTNAALERVAIYAVVELIRERVPFFVRPWLPDLEGM